MNNVKLLRVRLVTVTTLPFSEKAPIMTGPDVVAHVARTVLPTDREGFLVIHLDSRNAIRSMELVSIGSLNSCIVHPREVFKAAILANAASIILAHNHPSGDPTPSPEDLAITRRLRRAGQLLGIDVRDHVVVTAEAYVSFMERNLR